MPVAGHLDQRIVIVRDAFRTFLDLLVGDDVVNTVAGSLTMLRMM